MNKFLKQYPKLREPKVGDRIEIVKTINANKKYQIGDTATITHIGNTLTIVQFNNGLTEIPLLKNEYELI